MFTAKDLQAIRQRGSDPKTVEKQTGYFKKGFPWMKIVGPATPERGITILSEAEADEAVRYADTAAVAGKCKFVPASGAASRMFKDIFAGLEKLESGEDLPADAPGSRLAAHIKDFAFYTPALFGEPEDSPAYRKDVLEKVLTDKGYGYGSKPKGVIKFHRYGEEVRTALAEHLVEAQEYMRGADGVCRLTVTISPEHRSLFEEALAEVKPVFEQRYGVRYDVRFTYQDKATDTLAVDGKNKPFRKDDGSVVLINATGEWIKNSVNNIDYTMTTNGLTLGDDATFASYPGTAPEIVKDALAYAKTNARIAKHYNVGSIAAEEDVGSSLNEKRNAFLTQAVTASVEDFDKVFDEGLEDYMISGGQDIIDERIQKLEEIYGIKYAE